MKKKRGRGSERNRERGRKREERGGRWERSKERREKRGGWGSERNRERGRKEGVGMGRGRWESSNERREKRGRVTEMKRGRENGGRGGRERETEKKADTGEPSSSLFVPCFVPVYPHAIQDENEIEFHPVKIRRSTLK